MKGDGGAGLQETGNATQKRCEEIPRIMVKGKGRWFWDAGCILHRVHYCTNQNHRSWRDVSKIINTADCIFP